MATHVSSSILAVGSYSTSASHYVSTHNGIEFLLLTTKENIRELLDWLIVFDISDDGNGEIDD